MASCRAGTQDCPTTRLRRGLSFTSAILLLRSAEQRSFDGRRKEVVPVLKPLSAFICVLGGVVEPSDAGGSHGGKLTHISDGAEVTDMSSRRDGTSLQPPRSPTVGLQDCVSAPLHPDITASGCMRVSMMVAELTFEPLGVCEATAR